MKVVLFIEENKTDNMHMCTHTNPLMHTPPQMVSSGRTHYLMVRLTLCAYYAVYVSEQAPSCSVK